MTRIGGRYEILDDLGAGSMGKVYRARDTLFDRDVALKTIRTGAEVEPELRERFYREARSCARLQHPGIISVFDLGEADQTAYIAMELLEGMDFRKAIDQRLELALSKKIEVICQVCDALGHAHRHGIIHRDIKPSNLFLLNDGRAKILDFGIARLPSSHLTVAGQILGTPNYMAPEQILSKPSDTRSDLFSAAVVFFEFFTYSHPFKSPIWIPRRVVEGEPDSLVDYEPSIPAPLDRVLSRALAKNPDERYQSSAEFAEDLRFVLDLVQKNASPSFSLAELPSDRGIRRETALPAAPEQIDPTLVKQPPRGEDPYEWRLSEVLRLVPELEDAIDRGNVSLAQRLLREIEAINAVDSRFTDAVAFCRTLIAKIAPPSPPVEAKVSRPFADSEVTNILEPTTMPISIRIPPISEQPPLGQTEPTQGGVATPTPAPPVALPEPSKRAPAAQSRAWQSAAANWRAGHPIIVALSLGAVVLAAILAVRLWALRPVPMEPSVGTGVISAGRAAVYKESTGKSTAIELSQGARVNLLALPTSRDQEWVRVQFVPVGGKASPSGFLRLHDLSPSSLETGDAASQLALIRMFGTGSADAMEATLKVFIDRFPSTHEANEAALEVAEIELGAAEALKNAGRLELDWSGQLEVVRKYLELAASDPLLAERVALLRKQLDDMIVKPIKPPPPIHPPPPPPPNDKRMTAAQIKTYLDQAEGLLQVGDAPYAQQVANLSEAEKLVRNVLRSNPDHPEALKTLDKISRLRKVVLGQ